MILYSKLMLIHIMLNIYGLIAQLVEQRTENPRVGGSIPSQATSGNSSVDRASPCQGEGRGFEPRFPLHFFIKLNMAP